MPRRKVPKTPTASLPHSTPLPHTRDTRRLLTRLPKPALTALARRWLDPAISTLYAPNLTDPDDDDSEDTIPLEAAAAAYEDQSHAPGIRAKDVAEHMLEHEWRDGLTLLGVAEAEWEYLLLHPSSSKWQSLLLAPLTTTTTTTTPLRPRFHTPAFLAALTSSLRPFQTPHFFTKKHPDLPVTMVRVSLHTPHIPPAFPARGRAFWLAFPAGADHVFTTLGASNKDGLRDAVVGGMAAAVSRPGCRFDVKPGRLTAKTLESMVAHRGGEGGRAGGMAGGWSVYATGFEESPIAATREITNLEDEPENGEQRKRAKMVQAAFGSTAVGDGAGVESVYFEVQERIGGWRPTIGVRLEGDHVFAGVRMCAEVESGGFVVEKLPGWMRGEEGVSSGVVREGKVRRGKGRGGYSGA